MPKLDIVLVNLRTALLAHEEHVEQQIKFMLENADAIVGSKEEAEAAAVKAVDEIIKEIKELEFDLSVYL